MSYIPNPKSQISTKRYQISIATLYTLPSSNIAVKSFFVVKGTSNVNHYGKIRKKEKRKNIKKLFFFFFPFKKITLAGCVISGSSWILD